MKKIKLGQSDEMERVGTPEEPEPYYPQIHINHPDSIHIPDQGMATVKHKVVSRHIDKKHGKHSATLEIHSFEPHPKKVLNNSASKAMQGLMDEQ